MCLSGAEQMLLLAFFCQVALDAADVNHDRRSNHHLTKANRAPYRYFVMVEGSFQSAHCRFNCRTQVSMAFAIDTHTLTA